MKVSELIKRLEDAKEAEGDFLIKEWKITIPSCTMSYALNSKKDKNKKMSLKEYLELCKEGDKK